MMDGHLVSVDAGQELKGISGKLDSLIGLVNAQSVQIARLEERLASQQDNNQRTEDRVSVLEKKDSPTGQDHRGLMSRVNIMSGAAMAIAFFVPLLFQWQPWKQSHPDAVAYPAAATEKRQDQYPQRIPQPQEPK